MDDQTIKLSEEIADLRERQSLTFKAIVLPGEQPPRPEGQPPVSGAGLCDRAIFVPAIQEAGEGKTAKGPER